MAIKKAADWGSAVRAALQRHVRTVPKPREVSCVDCGFMARFNDRTEQFREFGLESREHPFGMDDGAWGATPVCFVGAYRIDNETSDTINLLIPVVRAELEDPEVRDYTNRVFYEATRRSLVELFATKRVCESFITFRPGYSPKEHRDMREREEWNKYIEEQRESDRRWRIVELVILTLGAGMFTLIGALLSR